MTVPHLPVADPPSRRRSPKKTLLLWILLVVMFLLIYQHFAPPEPHPAPPREPRSWVPALVGLFGVASIALILAWSRAMRGFGAGNNEALKLLAGGQLAPAREQFAALAKRYRWKSLRASALHNVALVDLRAGRLDAALDGFAAAEALARKAMVGNVRRLVTLQLALGYALKNDLTAAQSWLSAFERLPGEEWSLETLARAIIDCRRGNFAEVARGLEARWRELENRLTGDAMRPLRVLRAFAVAQAGTRDAEQAPVLLQPLGPGARQELAWLGVAWPELAAFIATHLS